MTEKDFDWTHDLHVLLPIMADLFDTEYYYYHQWQQPTSDDELTALTDKVIAMEDGNMKDEALIFTGFFTTFLSAILALKKDPISVIPSTGGRSQQGYSDRRLEIANQLSQLPRFTAKCRLTKLEKGTRKPLVEEHVFTTIKEDTDRGMLARNKSIVVANTRRDYCTPRAVVEEQIRQRITGDSEATKRRG